MLEDIDIRGRDFRDGRYVAEINDIEKWNDSDRIQAALP
jgi:hypothetical protein